MERRLALVLVIALSFAGCTGGGDEGEGAPTPTPSATTTPETTPTPTATPEPTPPPSPTPPPTPSPTPIPPQVNVTLRHDYANASENLTFTIPAGAPTLTLELQFDTASTVLPGQYVCSPGLRIKIIRPDGSIHDEVTSSAGSGQNVHCGQTRVGTATPPTDFPPGEWHASFEGVGTGIGWVRVFAQA